MSVWAALPCGLQKTEDTDWGQALQQTASLPVCDNGHADGVCSVTMNTNVTLP